MQKELNKKPFDEEVGKILWEIESFENFFPCYKSMMKKE